MTTVTKRDDSNEKWRPKVMKSGECDDKVMFRGRLGQIILNKKMATVTTSNVSDDKWRQ